jgi:hypothetical protein
MCYVYLTVISECIKLNVKFNTFVHKVRTLLPKIVKFLTAVNWISFSKYSKLVKINQNNGTIQSVRPGFAHIYYSNWIFLHLIMKTELQEH